MSNTKKTTKANTTTKKEEPKVMTFMQAKALTNALFHSHQTKAKLSENIDKLPEKVRGKGMKPEAKAKWLEEHGQEEASYGQCKMFAYGLLNAKYPYEKASAMIADLDKKNGYVRTPKETKEAEKVVKDTNAKAKEESLDSISFGNEEKADTPKA